jgi:putative transcriptional regulator
MFAENKLQPQPGRILIAEPFLQDGYFKRSVVLLAEHNEKGTVGFILNRPLDFGIDEMIPDFTDGRWKALLGGPVQRDQLFYIHTLGEKIPDSILIAPGLWWLGNFEMVRQMIAEKEIGVNEIRFFVGYSGWEKNQLDTEMKEKAWFISRTKLDFIFSEKPETMWEEGLKNMGASFAQMTKFPENPNLN